MALQDSHWIRHLGMKPVDVLAFKNRKEIREVEYE